MEPLRGAQTVLLSPFCTWVARSQKAPSCHSLPSGLQHSTPSPGKNGCPQTRDIRPDLSPFACGSGHHSYTGMLVPCMCVWGGKVFVLLQFFGGFCCLCTGVCFSGQDTFLSFSDTLLLQSAVSIRPCEAENLSPDPTTISDISC